MSPGRSHEQISRTIAYLIGLWCAEHGIKFTAFGGWTLQDQAVARAIEPDDRNLLRKS